MLNARFLCTCILSPLRLKTITTSQLDLTVVLTGTYWMGSSTKPYTAERLKIRYMYAEIEKEKTINVT